MFLISNKTNINNINLLEDLINFNEQYYNLKENIISQEHSLFSNKDILLQEDYKEKLKSIWNSIKEFIAKLFNNISKVFTWLEEKFLQLITNIKRKFTNNEDITIPNISPEELAIQELDKQIDEYLRHTSEFNKNIDVGKRLVVASAIGKGVLTHYGQNAALDYASDKYNISKETLSDYKLDVGKSLMNTATEISTIYGVSYSLQKSNSAIQFMKIKPNEFYSRLDILKRIRERTKEVKNKLDNQIKNSNDENIENIKNQANFVSKLYSNMLDNYKKILMKFSKSK
jgi:hypothetical protein